MLQQESPVQTKTPCNATWPFHDDTAITFGQKYCRSSQRAQQEIQEPSSNTEKQEIRAMPN